MGAWMEDAGMHEEMMHGEWRPVRPRGFSRVWLALTRPWRALQALRAMEVPDTYRWKKAGDIVAVQIEMSGDFGVRGKLWGPINMHGEAGDTLSIVVQMKLQVPGEEADTREMALVPLVELERLGMLSRHFGGRG